MRDHIRIDRTARIDGVAVAQADCAQNCIAVVGGKGLAVAHRDERHERCVGVAVQINAQRAAVLPGRNLAVPLDGNIELVEVGCLVASVSITGRLCLACAYGVGGGIAARDCRLLEYLCRGGRARAAFLGILGGGIDLVVSHRVGRRHLELKGGLGTQILSIALNGDLRLGGRDSVDGAVFRDGGSSNGERVIAGQQLNAATMFVNVERFAHGRTVGILPAHLYGNLGAG